MRSYDEQYIFEDLKWPNMSRAYGSQMVANTEADWNPPLQHVSSLTALRSVPFGSTHTTSGNLDSALNFFGHYTPLEILKKFILQGTIIAAKKMSHPEKIEVAHLKNDIYIP